MGNGMRELHLLSMLCLFSPGIFIVRAVKLKKSCGRYENLGVTMVTVRVDGVEQRVCPCPVSEKG